MWLAISLLAVAVLFLRLSLVRLGAAVERYRECSIKATHTWIATIRQAVTLDLARFERLPAETLGREEAIAQCRGLLDTLARMSGVALLLLATSCGHIVNDGRQTHSESVPFSCHWTRKACEDCLAVLRSKNVGEDLLVPVDRSACPACNGEEDACKPAPAGLKTWPDTREEEEGSDTSSDAGGEE